MYMTIPHCGYGSKSRGNVCLKRVRLLHCDTNFYVRRGGGEIAHKVAEPLVHVRDKCALSTISLLITIGTRTF